MGGNLLDAVSKERIQKDKYLKMQQTLLEIFKGYYEIVCSPVALPEKETFGDLDFQCFGQNSLMGPSFFTDHPIIQSKQVIITNPQSSLSFEFDCVQVDLKLYHDRQEYENDLLLMSMGGIGNMLGFAFKAIGLKWNNYGLFYNLQMPENNRYIRLCQDSKQIQKFLGKDLSLLPNLQTDQQVFEELCSLPFLLYDSVFKRMEYVSKKDSGKMRPSVLNFVNYYLKTRSNHSFKHFETKEFEDDILFPEFPDILAEVKMEQSKAIKLYTVKQKFNGKLVQSIIEKISPSRTIQGITLGKFTSDLRSSLGSLESFQEFIYSNSPEKITELIVTFFQDNQEKYL